MKQRKEVITSSPGYVKNPKFVPVTLPTILCVLLVVGFVAGIAIRIIEPIWILGVLVSAVFLAYVGVMYFLTYGRTG